ncbi:MAG: GTP cyclohydrolase II [Candidatus Burarchaeum sp.]|nr:GTP cyclohydrolase II [Candidatus Burarchaeum sp.]MDO8340109.1 GTP cyclohydrolase II [Candidatus Burarchaeum sp.]
MKFSNAKLPTRLGAFRVYAFVDKDGKEHAALVKGNVKGKARVPVRIHSSCLTGDVFGSLKCDCRAQLEAALRFMARRPFGIIVYLNQEGRGIGLYNKIRAYALQEQGYDTAEANEMLGFSRDGRDFGPAARMLKFLGVKSVLLLTNNPLKMYSVCMHGIKVAGRIPLHTKPTKYNRRYLATKIVKLGHYAD